MKGFVLTMQYNEFDLLPIWISHYKRYFDSSQLYVIDHGSIENLIPHDISRIFFPKDKPFKEDYRRDAVRGVVFALLNYYDYGIFCDTDELICLDNFKAEEMAPNQIIYTYGYDVAYYQLNGHKRLIGSLTPTSCKPLIFNNIVPIWASGFHGCSTPPDYNQNQSITMAHIKYLHPEFYTRSLEYKKAAYETMAEYEKEAGVASHWVDPNDLNKFYANMQLALDSYLIDDLPDLNNYIKTDHNKFFRVADLDRPYLRDLTDDFSHLL